MFRHLGYLLQGAIFIGSGLSKVTAPADTVAEIKKTLFPKLFNELTGGAVKLDLTLLTQAIGVAMLLFGTMLIVGFARRLAAWALFFLLAAITAFVHVNLENPKATPLPDMIQVMKNASILGSLLVVANAPRFPKAAVRNASPSDKPKRS